MARPDGGYVSGYVTPSQTAARGVWSMREAFRLQSATSWPLSRSNPNTQLLLHMNGTNNSSTFTDNSVSPKTVTANGSAVISTAASKFGGASGSFTATSSFLTIADQDATELSNKNFVLELFFNTTSSTSFVTLVSRLPSTFATGTWTLMMNYASATAGDCAFFAFDAASAAPLMVGGSGLRDGAWHHVAVSRSGSTWNLYIDGTRVATATSSATVANINGAIYIGRDQGNGNARQFVGYMDELRFVVGSAAGYTGASIQVPADEFPNLS